MNQPQRRPEPAEAEVGDERLGAAADPRKVEEKKKRSEQREQRRVNGLRLALQQADTRLWLWELLGFCGISRSSFTGNSTTFFNEGQRNVGLRIQADLTKHFPKEYVEMLKEGEANA